MQLRCAGRTLELDRPVVMGVLNITPDSFSDGARYLALPEALARAERIAAEGAAIIDIGGESTRPGARPVETEEQLRRVLPVLEQIARTLPSLIISVDTSSPGLIRRAADAGAHLINDVRALRTPGALEALAASSLGARLMHMRGEPHDMQLDPQYVDVIAEVRAYLAARVHACLDAGIARNRLAIDPGFCFGKQLSHNLDLLRGLPALLELNAPLLVGLSRKSMVAALCARTDAHGAQIASAPYERLAGSLALATIAVLNGAQIVRAHDVAATVDAVRVAAAVRRRSA
jgi:dihydropteroate synthase